jgi:hypothetical protein
MACLATVTPLRADLDSGLLLARNAVLAFRKPFVEATMGKKILMLVGEFSEEYEIFVFEQCMHAVGHTVHVICPGKKAGDVIKTSLHDFEGDQT